PAPPRGACLPRVVPEHPIAARPILDTSLTPTVEPELEIHSPRKIQAEVQLRTSIRAEPCGRDQAVILEPAVPEVDDCYPEFVRIRGISVLALSGRPRPGTGHRWACPTSLDDRQVLPRAERGPVHRPDRPRIRRLAPLTAGAACRGPGRR